MNFRWLFLGLVCLSLSAAQPPEDRGRIAGQVVDDAGHHPIPFATVSLQNQRGEKVRTTATDENGSFAFEGLPWGDYQLRYGVLGADTENAMPVHLDAARPQFNLGGLKIPTAVVTLGRMEVRGGRDAFYNSIDRKVYDVGKSVQAATGSASDVLQNIPSVEVDLDGNVSLRGNGNVLVLIDGKSSVLMNAANRADALQQLPADTIEQIEVITNPSAKYQPDGTAGIINIVLKQQHEPGVSGSVRANDGHASRSNFGLTVNEQHKNLTAFVNVNVRQDDRLRFVDEYRTHPDPVSGAPVSTEEHTVEHMRPLARFVQSGVDDDLGPDDRVGASVSYNLRTFFRVSTIRNLTRSSDGTTTSDYDRMRVDPEWQKTTSGSATYRHAFDGTGHDLDLEIKRDRHWEQEANHYTNTYRLPALSSTSDTVATKPTETTTELTADYTRPLADDGKFEAGYDRQVDRYDMSIHSGFFDPAHGITVPDPTQTSRFLYRGDIEAAYVTFARSFGRLGLLAGLRLEDTSIETNQLSTQQNDTSRYFRAYPTLHLAWTLSETGQLQLNYSHRIHRPETEDLDPFPEYQDPFNLRAGNAHLQPEETHSVEAGYQYHRDATTYLATLYYRNTYHAFTTATRYLNASTLLTTQENLATNQSGGLEAAATREIGPVSLNLSANVFVNQIDGSNLGYPSLRSTRAWAAKANIGWRITKTTVLEFNSNYSARRLTPQGERSPTFIANFGVRHDLPQPNLALVFTVSDVCNSLRERTIIDTPALHDDLTRRRSSRLFFFGAIYSFGSSKKKPKDNGLQFDSSL